MTENAGFLFPQTVEKQTAFSLLLLELPIRIFNFGLSFQPPDL
jgi:hypothetical protein